MPPRDAPPGCSFPAMRLVTIALALCLLGAAVASAATKSVSATESNGLGFSKKKIKVAKGSVTLKMKNPKGNVLDHNIAIRGNGVSKKGKEVGPGGTSTVTASLKKGKYTFYCTVSDHEADGMKGRLKVTG